MPLPMPTAVAVANLLTDLVGRDVSARSTGVVPLDAKRRAIAVYREPDKTLKALACCDLAVGGSLAAGLTVMPVGLVDDGVKAGRLEGGLVENLYEVFNVLSAVFPKSGLPRVLLTRVDHDGAADADVATLLARPAQRLDLDVTVSGYRPGKLTIVVQ